MKQILHTPEGVRDIYGLEYAKKLAIQEKLHKVLHLYGYQDVQTPAFEYFDVFCKEIGTISSKELYKFFDREGNTLVLRPDITPSIARVSATFFADQTLPIRLCYMGNTFINQSSYRGKLKESTQLGAELVGDATVQADAEMLALVIDSLRAVGLEEFQITVGNAAYFQSILNEACMDEEEELRARELITNRNYFGLDEQLREIHMNEKTRNTFSQLAELVGGQEILSAAKQNAPNETAKQAITHLEELYEILQMYGMEKYVTFDLSMSGTYGYYTGIVFRGYTYGTGDAIVKGGRYDRLIAKFGKDLPSIGFAIVVDELMNALSRQKIHVPLEQRNALIIYEKNREKEAVILAQEYRRSGRNTELLWKHPDKALEEYKDYGRKHMVASLIYLGEGEEIERMEL